MRKKKLKELKEVNGVLLLKEYDKLLRYPEPGLKRSEILNYIKDALVTINADREFTRKRTIRVLRILSKNENLSDEVKALTIKKINSMF